MNLVSTIMQFLTPVITNRIASALGVNNAMVTSAIGAIVPALLAALAGKASSPEGATALARAVDQQDPGLLGSLTNMLGGAGQSAVVNNGASILTSLLGGSASNALAGAVGKFTGANAEQSSSLIGMLAPVIMGNLAQQQRAGGLDGGGLARLLDSQKANIAAALPSGFAPLLAGSGLLDAVAHNLKVAAPAAPAAQPAAAPRAEAPRVPAAPEAPAFNWMPWALAAVVLLGLFWYFGSKPASSPVAVEKTAAPAVPGASAVVDQAKSLIGGLTSTLGNIKDQATAQAAVPQLTTTSAGVDTLVKLAGTLGPDAKSQLAAVIATALPQLSPLMATVLKIPGAEAILKPVLDAIMIKMTGLAKV